MFGTSWELLARGGGGEADGKGGGCSRHEQAVIIGFASRQMCNKRPCLETVCCPPADHGLHIIRRKRTRAAASLEANSRVGA